MSHLPLDARAILQHLNELGYRNISAEQLREFLKGMQPQSDKQSASKSKFATTRANTNSQQQPQPEPQHKQYQPHQRSKVKVIKSKRPLCHFKFYLDICDHQLTKRIETEIKALGGSLEFFLNDSITHFITDKDNPVHPQQQARSRPGTPQTPNTPHTPNTPSAASNNEDGTGLHRRSRQTRADTILSRVRVAQQQNLSSNLHQSQQQQQHSGGHQSRQISGKLSTAAYTVWQTEHALRFFHRIQTELRQYLHGPVAGAGKQANLQAPGTSNIQLKGNFIKIESIKRSHRPYYHIIKQPEEWPKIDLSSEDGAFRLLAKADVQSMTRKSIGSRTSQRQQEKDKNRDTQQPQSISLQHAVVQTLKKQTAALQTPDSPRSHCKGDFKESSDKQCGVCEICKIEYDTLTIHLQSKDHELFARNAQNFLALDTLIQVSANVNEFLEREEKQQNRNLGSVQIDIETETDMDVDELLNDSAIALNTALNPNDAHVDPLHLNISNSSNNNTKQRPSPALREKSKRINKGKHSSEKFQASPNTPPNIHSPSPSKKITTCSLLELQRMDQTGSNATITAVTPTNTTRRKTQSLVLSPPKRAMLPPSSLYKVVEASDANATPPRIRRGAANAADNVINSPSLIVKFQKVRQSELQRLNGEAENFMFPKSTTRSSSELPTDIDRHTTSDAGRGHHSISSASLDSTSEAELTVTPAILQRRATAVGRRRKVGAAPASQMAATLQLQRQLSTGSSSSNGGQQQRFPTAPIQPDMQTQLLRQRQTTATRKSSRTATAIVTAATTSSQLQLRRQTQSSLHSKRKLEDRMGELKTVPIQQKNISNRKSLEVNDEDDNEDDDDDDESSCSSGSDEDYVATSKGHKSETKPNPVDTREQRAARRLSRLTINLIRTAEEQQMTVGQKSPARVRGKIQKPPTIAKSKQCKQQTTTTATATTIATDLMFDCSKSERLQKLRYSFEELPDSELWHRVFQRQDAGEEQYYSYYGSTRYHKLPYELGPIPMERTRSHSCTICQELQQQQQQPKNELKLQILRPSKLDPDREQDFDQNAAQSDSNLTAATTTTTSSMYKHKKLHLLQRYQQEQNQQQRQQQQHHTINTAVPIEKCDSKASTPELLERDFAPLSERTQLVERVRATSTQSSASSSCSNSQKSGATCRNKQLARIAELPPRKSPREHASTLALVSCIIRQRQDSQSKTNSEAEEPIVPTPATLTPAKAKTQLKQEQEPVVPVAMPSTLNTRSQAATPVEELRFATEISETVKRMRRGQNKYDSLPSAAPVAAPPPRTTTLGRCRRPTAAAAAAAASYSRRLQFAGREVNTAAVLLGKRKRRTMTVASTVRQPQQHPPGLALVKGVRKLPSKKGLLEYEMESSALKALDANMQHVNPLFIAWQIDKYLELTGKEFDLSGDEQLSIIQPMASNRDGLDLREEVHTPPPTDNCFTNLRKLIKYEERLATNSKEDNFSSLHKRDTISSRAKLSDKDKDKENEPSKLVATDKEQFSSEANRKGRMSEDTTASNLNLETIFREKIAINDKKVVRRSRSKTRKPSRATAGRTSSGDSSSLQDAQSSGCSRSRKLRPRSTSRVSAQSRGQENTKRKHPQNDPVALYHYYQSEWAHFRDQIPGAKSHSNIRCTIRHKLLDHK